jgi:hypothetical protein
MRSMLVVGVTIIGLSTPVDFGFAKDRLWSAFAVGVRDDSVTVIGTAADKSTKDEALSEARAACVNESGDGDHCFAQIYDKCYYVFTLQHRSLVPVTVASNSISDLRQTKAIDCQSPQDRNTCSDIRPVCNR